MRLKRKKTNRQLPEKTERLLALKEEERAIERFREKLKELLDIEDARFASLHELDAVMEEFFGFIAEADKKLDEAEAIVLEQAKKVR